MQPEPWMLVPFAIVLIFLYYWSAKKQQEWEFMTLHRFLADDSTRVMEDISNHGPLGSRTLLFSVGKENLRYAVNTHGSGIIESLTFTRAGKPRIRATFRDERLITVERSDKVGDQLCNLTQRDVAALLSLLYRFRGYAS